MGSAEAAKEGPQVAPALCMGLPPFRGHKAGGGWLPRVACMSPAARQPEPPPAFAVHKTGHARGRLGLPYFRPFAGAFRQDPIPVRPSLSNDTVTRPPGGAVPDKVSFD
jgi:hypothetical protein